MKQKNVKYHIDVLQNAIIEQGKEINELKKTFQKDKEKRLKKLEITNISLIKLFLSVAFAILALLYIHATISIKFPKGFFIGILFLISGSIIIWLLAEYFGWGSDINEYKI